jgi:hypothetical protein
MNLDTGEPSKPADYTLADMAYSELAVRLADLDAAAVDPKIRANILAYYGNLDLPFFTKTDRKQWQRTVAAIGKLKAETADASR